MKIVATRNTIVTVKSRESFLEPLERIIYNPKKEECECGKWKGLQDALYHYQQNKTHALSIFEDSSISELEQFYWYPEIETAPF